jgi:hypothetical protein
MIREDNTKKNLNSLLLNNKITLEQYFFRLQAEKLNINTYQLKH